MDSVTNVRLDADFDIWFLPSADTEEKTKKDIDFYAKTGLVNITEKEYLRMSSVPVSSWELERNPISVPDRFELVTELVSFPFDPANLSEFRVQLRLQDAAAPTFFVGLVENIRVDASNGTVTLSGEDLTAILVNWQVSTGIVRQLNFQVSFFQLLRQILDMVPGCRNWPLYIIDDEGAQRDALSVQEVAQTKSAFQDSMTGAERASIDELDKLFSLASDIVAKKISANTLIKTLKSSNMAQNGKISIWEIILKLCTLVGLVPEVATTKDGNPALAVISAIRVHTGSIVWPKEATLYRTLDVSEQASGLKIEKKLIGQKAPDLVQVFSVDAVSRKVISATYGPAVALAKKKVQVNPDKLAYQQASKTQSIEAPQQSFVPDTVLPPTVGLDGVTIVTQIAPGTMSLPELKELARLVWYSMAKRDYEVTLDLNAPWTSGGSKENPDMLYCRSGAGIFVSTPNPGIPHDRVLRNLGIPEEAISRYTQYMLKNPAPRLYQIRAIRHRCRDRYTCELTLIPYLDSNLGQWEVYDSDG